MRRLVRQGTLLVAAMLATGCLDSSAPAEDPPQRGRTRNHSDSDPTAPTSPDSNPTPAPTTGTSTRQPSGANADRLTAIADTQVFAAFLIQEQQVEMGLLYATTYYCDSPDPLSVDTGNGSIAVAFDDVDPPGRSTGDSFLLTYTKCRQFGQTIDGTSGFTVDEVSGVAYAPAPSLWRLTTSHTTTLVTTSANGTQTLKTLFHFTNGTPDGVAYDRHISGSFDSTVSNGAPLKTSFDNSANWNIGQKTFSQTVNSAFSVETYTFKLETLAPMTGTLGQTPTAGAAKIAQLFSTTNMITTFTVLTNSTVKVELDTNADGIVDVTYETPWDGSQIAGYFTNGM